MNTTLTSKTMTRNSLAAAIAIAIALTVPSIAQAAAKAWTCTNSYWDYASCWSSSGVPSSADNVYVGAVSGGDSVLKIDGYTGNAYANGLTVDSTIATPTVQQTGGALSISVGGIGERIGYSGTGAYSQTGGTHTVSGYLEMGWYAGSHGAYSLSGGTLNLQGDPSSDSLIVANYGTADFNQSGGAVNVGNTLVAGTRSGGAGTYELGGAGSLTAGQEFIGRSGTGTFTQNGGTHIVSGQLTLGSNIYGQATYGTGRYYLNGGALSADSEVIGEQGVGQLAQNGGTNTVAGDLMLGGGDPNLPGTYQLYGGTLTVHGNIVTGSGHSTLEVDSGTLNVDGNIDVVNFTVGGPGRVGSYTLSGSRSLNATYENIGEYLSGYSGGHGTMSQTGGTNSGNFLNLGLGGGGAVGAYHLSGTGVVSMESE
ncbi:MAG TPA: hypothetical protein VKA76_08720, partial [Gammaproteobacteria bacterium]|nr:hypothetical protein [Gammaproteobacteria bacterium]